ncbi:MAG: hypothetical protein RQ833_09275 [Sphingomonadaceae bacterium]|nr:hypothetical protein [Sphingomonadaceae bacterium]
MMISTLASLALIAAAVEVTLRSLRQPGCRAAPPTDRAVRFGQV